jgi:hypothetical protein
MVKIINEYKGKVYKFIPRVYGCKGCAFECDGKYNCLLDWKDSKFNDLLVCGHLDGMWQDMTNQYEYGVEYFYNGHWIIEQTGLDELCEAKDYIEIHKKNHPEDKLRPIRREIGKWKEVKDNEKTA